MSVRNGLFCMASVVLVVGFAFSIGCEAMKEYDYYADTKESGLSTGQTTDLPNIMQQMRTANLKLVDSLIYMHAQNIMSNSVQMFELAKALKQSQPAVALQAPDDADKFRKLADDLSEIIVQVGAAANAGRMELADWHYTQAFPICNRCHSQFRQTAAPKLLTIPEIKPPVADIELVPEAGATETPATPELAPVPVPELVE